MVIVHALDASHEQGRARRIGLRAPQCAKRLRQGRSRRGPEVALISGRNSPTMPFTTAAAVSGLRRCASNAAAIRSSRSTRADVRSVGSVILTDPFPEL